MQHGLVKGKFVGHVAVQAALLEERSQTEQEFMEILSHGDPPPCGLQDACMTNATADERRVQRCASALSFFRPSAVSS